MIKHVTNSWGRNTEFFSAEGTYSRFEGHISWGECEQQLRISRAMARQVRYVVGGKSQ
jgi:hypothetical protein